MFAARATHASPARLASALRSGSVRQTGHSLRATSSASGPSFSTLAAARSYLPSSRTSTVGCSSLGRAFSTTPAARRATPIEEGDGEPFDLSTVERVSDEVDVIIVGGGPAGLSAAIKIKQLAEERGEEIRVVVLEKGPEVGNHILSGAVIQTNALDELLPNWKELGAPLNQPALEDHMRFLTPTGSFPMPHPPQMSNKGNYIVSLSRVVAWLGEQAEAAGVEIYPGFAAAQPLWQLDDAGKPIGIKGVITNEIGLDKSRKPKDSFEPGMEFHAPITLFAEGAHGSMTQKMIKQLGLRDAVGADAQTYGLGVKEVWRVKPEKHQAGLVTHTMGWPLDTSTYGGSWTYHMEDNMVSLGLVVGLDYQNPYLSPFREFQRMKHHPFFKDLLEGGECLAYGARTLNEGGYQSIPKLHFPGGALVGCAAGFLNVPKIKGTHNAMKSGMVAAEAVVEALAKRAESGSEETIDLADYKTRLDDTYVMKELYEVRNLRPSFHGPLGFWGGLAYSGLDSMILKGRVPWTFHHPGEDHAQTKPAAQCEPIEYPKPDGTLSFDILTSVSRTGTNHAEDQPVHLIVKDGDYKAHVERNVGTFEGPLGRCCPAGVYEYVDADTPAQEDALGKKLVINSQNCIHCYTCSIKTPDQSIRWDVPEGGGGPKYSLT
ncbi:probable flavoprotein-ubiquinone oxidoreductase [Sporisorium reilianum f. sp. reilianum]|uniref:Electron transfer flavoprotein-ubiquinone oxidoreductase n=1 Tax=Sporisorium reilianum f. sp. reilianum TaxID=72559 RepID=A0A2N8UAF8_9BASI|nr:probable flavoprotein-ubiquinone oxidoreductase [Sporisorium reilianum f. sp. reilianum]